LDPSVGRSKADPVHGSHVRQTTPVPLGQIRRYNDRGRPALVVPTYLFAARDSDITCPIAEHGDSLRSTWSPDLGSVGVDRI